MELQEPEWLVISEGELLLDLEWASEPIRTLRLAYRSDEGIRFEEKAPVPRLALTPQPGDHGFMIALDNRWIARWFELP